MASSGGQSGWTTVTAYVRATLRLTTSEADGRRRPIASGYRCNCWLGGLSETGERAYHDAVVYVENGETLEPGAASILRPVEGCRRRQCERRVRRIPDRRPGNCHRAVPIAIRFGGDSRLHVLAVVSRSERHGAQITATP